jgi:cellobiose phosphorylase
MRFGTHDLPLMGSCDWNDGMDKVGAQGKGESVWLGFFLHQVLNEFADIAQLREDAIFAEQCETQAITLARNIDLQAWDGAWYRRAYFDDGTPLGSHENSECQIDSISQSWSVLSGCGTQEHRQQAMQSLHERLVQKDDGLILLLDPPFNQAGKNPGYISGYVPGVRENGGQYTHAAIWAAMAFAKMGDTEKAWEAFDIVNPLRHADTPANIARYKVEPYVIAADVYGVAPHTGRGGWTWYTGSAGWMYTLILESLLGLQRHGHFLTISPCIPASWNGFEIHYQFGLSMYHISIRVSQESNASARMSVDAQPSEDLRIALIDDGAVHQVVYQLSQPGESQSDSLPPPSHSQAS